MEDYTKFRLKPKDELIPLLEEADNLFVLSCNKCFTEFQVDDEPECCEFRQIATEHGNTLVGNARIDFLCNKTLTAKKLESLIPPEAENVCVIACGIGIQTIADLVDKPVCAVSDSISYTGSHGMALTNHRCEACGQCYLNLTGGICPVVDCAKSLINGQCGGAKNGKCETDKNKDCAWERIYQRLENQGRIADLSNQPIQLRDYSIVNYNFISKYVNLIREKRFEGFYGGVHPSERKELSDHISLVQFPDPRTVVIPLSQHAGAPAEPIVKNNEMVKVGQKIGEATGYVSSPVHSSISGIVTAIEPRPHPTTGADVLSIVIQSDGENSMHESVHPCGDLESLSKQDILDIIREKGIVGMGGAGFPTSVKLNSAKPIDTVLLNGCECEPLLTADHRVMSEFPDDVVFGLKVFLKAAGAEKGIIVIEDNKPDTIEAIRSITADTPNIEVAVVKTKYPQGAEKILIKAVLGRQVPSGGLPLDVGVIVGNVSTAKAASDAIQKGLPLIERVVTVSGEKLKKPGNFIVKIGVSVREIIDACGGLEDDDVTIKLGGSMMGAEIANLDVPVIKATNGIIAIEPVVNNPEQCIKCGRCVDACPMELLPLYYSKYADEENWNGMLEKNVRDCIECGCCEFICSSKIPLVKKIKAGKKAISEMR